LIGRLPRRALKSAAAQLFEPSRTTFIKNEFYSWKIEVPMAVDGVSIILLVDGSQLKVDSA
jgi:hypothetical protein